MRVARVLSRCFTLMIVGLLLAAGFAQAAPITFNFEFSGAPTNAARAVGFVTFEETLLSNPGMNDFDLPDPAVLDLEVTITGASSGNGTYGLSDFGALVFSTNGGTLDFSAELVGQPTSQDPWGTNDGAMEGSGGDFNLFITGGGASPQYGAGGPAAAFIGAPGAPAPPNGEYWFTLCADNGSSSCMELVSMRADGVPTLGTWGIVALVLTLLAAGVVMLRRRTVAGHPIVG